MAGYCCVGDLDALTIAPPTRFIVRKRRCTASLLPMTSSRNPPNTAQTGPRMRGPPACYDSGEATVGDRNSADPTSEDAAHPQQSKVPVAEEKDSGADTRVPGQ